MFASDMGMPVGQYPVMLKHSGAMYFFQRKDRDAEGDLVALIYRDKHNNTLTVFND